MVCISTDTMLRSQQGKYLLAVFRIYLMILQDHAGWSIYLMILQDHAGWSPEQFDLVSGNPAHNRGIGTTRLLRLLPTQAIQCMCYYDRQYCSKTADCVFVDKEVQKLNLTI